MPPEINAAGSPDAPYRLGKKPARPGAITFSLASYVNFEALPEPPDVWGHLDPPPFFDFDNKRYGCCVLATAANLTSLWLHEAGDSASFTTKDVLAAYTDVTGFDPAKPFTDQGSDMGEAASYWRHTGILDATNRRQRIDAYCKLDLGDPKKMRLAMYLLGGVLLGFRFPDFAMDDFDSGRMWDVQPWSLKRMVTGDKITGGHCVPAIGYTPEYLIVESWGKLTKMSWAFFERFADEIVCAFDVHRIHRIKQHSPEGFDERQLRTDLVRLGRGRVYSAYSTRYGRRPF